MGHVFTSSFLARIHGTVLCTISATPRKYSVNSSPAVPPRARSAGGLIWERFQVSGRLISFPPILPRCLRGCFVPLQHRLELIPGMTFTIEPIFTEGSEATTLWPDAWTVQTVDGGRAAQFEHVVLITEDGHEVLTVPSQQAVAA